MRQTSPTRGTGRRPRSPRCDMSTKTVVLTVELLVGTVSCPGVWLCPEGEVTLTVFALGDSHRTERLPPSFPLHYRDTFYFRKTFRSCSLNNLQVALKDETIYCELVQWKCDCEAQVLAQYLGSLADILFPPDTCTSDGVDLLMRSTSDFPGILAPKIEVSTKVRIDEVFEDTDENKEDNLNFSPLGDGSTAYESSVKRQKPVCHTKLYHRNRCSLSPRRTKSGRSSPRDRSPVPTYVSPVFTAATVKCEECRTGRARSSPPHLPPAGSSRQLSSLTVPLPTLHPYPTYDHEVKLKPDEISQDNSLYSDVSRRWTKEMPRITAITDRRVRVARILESNYTGGMESRASAQEAQQMLHHYHNSGGPCVCDICRRYHQLFHVN